MLSERFRVVRRSESVQKLRRPLDVGEQERDRPTREVLHSHSPSIKPKLTAGSAQTIDAAVKHSKNLASQEATSD